MGDWAAALQGLGAGMQGQGAQWAAAQEMQKRTEIDQEKLRREAFIQEGLMAESMIRNGRPDQALELFRSRVEAGSKLPPMQSLGGNFDASSHVLQLLEKGDAAGALAELSAGNQILRDAGIIQNQNAAYQFGASSMGKDEAGNLFQISQSRNPNTGAVETVMSPVGHNSPQQGQISIVGQMGLTSGETIDYRGSASSAEARASEAARAAYAAEIERLRQEGKNQGAAGSGGAPSNAELTGDAAAAEAKAKAEADSNAAQAMGIKQYGALDIALSNYEKALAETVPIPGGDSLRFTAAQQAAQLAKKQVGTALKNITRGSGEGVFAKDDREAMMAELPGIGDYGTARNSGFSTLRSRAKAGLNLPQDYSAAPPQTTPKLSSEDAAALEWAKANPNDPRAAAIMQHAGGR